MKRTERLIVGVAFLALAAALVALAGIGFTTSFAKTSVSCGAPLAEAGPERKPKGPSEEEAEYLVRTGNWDAATAYDQEVVAYFESKACGSAARSRLWKFGAAALVASSLGSALSRSALRRRPKVPPVRIPSA